MKKINFLIAALAFTMTSNANIIYTDIADETISTANPLDINFDGAGAVEFTIGFSPWSTWPNPWFNPDAGFVMVGISEHDNIKGLPNGTTINASSAFLNNGVDGNIGAPFHPTQFPSINDSYIGATFKISGNVHYGWIRVNWDGATLIVKDFAYEDTPNAQINAGDMGSVMVNHLQNQTINLEIYPNPTSEFIYIRGIDANIENQEIRIIDVAGKTVLKAVYSSKGRIDVFNLSPGQYFVSVGNSAIKSFIKR
ncbi:MAG: hypothetical protein ACI8Q1_002788 [Parvicella sp.]|jgi:hypothetical protein